MRDFLGMDDSYQAHFSVSTYYLMYVPFLCFFFLTRGNLSHKGF